jgi:hypothetical protein
VGEVSAHPVKARCGHRENDLETRLEGIGWEQQHLARMMPVHLLQIHTI